MSNALQVSIESFAEGFVSSYEAEVVLSAEADSFYPEPMRVQKGNETFYVPQDLQLTVVANTFDVSGSTPADLIERQIPTTFRNPDNVLYTMNAKELRDKELARKAGVAAGERLAWHADAILYSTVAARASNVVKKVGAFTWDDGASAEAMMVGLGWGAKKLKLFMNPTDYLNVAKDLGNRAYIGDRSKGAYERSQVPDIANFSTFRTPNQSTLAAIGTVTGTTVSGAQSYTPSAMTSNLPTDNRQMTLVVAGANIANIKNGDCFTIAGVNAVNMLDKTDTGQLKTFRVISGGGTANLVIYPAVIATGPYQNVTAVAGAGAAITFLNTVSKPVNIFWAEKSVYMDYGYHEFPSGMGPKVIRSKTKQGIPLCVSMDFNHLTGVCTVRNHVVFAPTVREPEGCGIIIANQT